MIELSTPDAHYSDVFLPLHGAHQADNAAIALTAAEVFAGAALDEDVVAEGLGAVRMPGRLEVVGHRPLIVLDGAHNVVGAETLARSARERVPPRSAHARRRVVA